MKNMKKLMLSIISSLIVTSFALAGNNGKDDQNNDNKEKVVNHKIHDMRSIKAKNTTKLSDKIADKPAGEVQTLKKVKMSSPQAKNKVKLSGEKDANIVADKKRKDMSSPKFKNQKHFRK